MKNMNNTSSLLFADGGFADPSKWQVELTEGAKASLRADPTKGKQVLRLDYDFNGRTGYVLMRRKIDVTLPDNYALSFRMQGQSPVNRLEVKWLSADTQSVWWWFNPSVQFPAGWETVRRKARHFAYGWGPEKLQLKSPGFIDVCVTATTGGSGTVWFDDMQLLELPPDRIGPISAVVKTSSGKRRPNGIFGEAARESWRSDKGEKQEVVLCLGEDREFGGIIIDWGKDGLPTAFDIDVRTDSSHQWRSIYTARKHGNAQTWVYAPECEASEIRLRLKKAKGKNGYRINRIALQPLEFSKSMNDFFVAVTKDFPRGYFPRQTAREMPFWTVVGVVDDTRRALVNHDGVVELDKMSCSVEPFVSLDGKLLTWYEGVHECTLEDGYLPLPKVVRKHEDVELTIKPWVDGMPGQSLLYCEYVLRNTSSLRRKGRLALALRPFQVNPPWQFLNWPGGFSPIKHLQWKQNTAIVNGVKQVSFHADGGIKTGATSLERGDVPAYLASGKMPMARSVSDSLGAASGVAVKDFDLAPGQELRVFWTCPMHDNEVPVVEPAESYARVRDFWRNKLARIKVTLPASAKDVELALKAQFGWVLVNRRGKAIQPGSRCYDRSWARDGALTSSALLHFGFHEEVRDFISWFAPYQFENGKIPCVVDHAGADPLPEHDSPGEFLFLVAEYLRYTGDREFVERLIPQVVKTVDYIAALLAENTQSAQHLCGILPPSVSHEGYFDKAAYSYWDNFWCLKGLNDALYLAEQFMGAEHLQTRRIAGMRESFRYNLYRSIRAAMKHHGIDFVPGAADRGDFDATSTTIALDPAMQVTEMLPEFWATFQKYWSYFLMRRSNQVEWNGYTPYEWRNVGAFIRLGQRGYAHEILGWFMRHRRPLGWQHWAEVVHRDPSTPVSVGDMPHTWVGSDFVRSVRSFLVYERHDGAIVVGAGIKYDWMFQPGELSFELATPHGTVCFSGKRSGYRYRIRLSGTCTAPIVLQLPYYAKDIRVDGRSSQLELPVRIPAEIVVDLD